MEWGVRGEEVNVLPIGRVQRHARGFDEDVAGADRGDLCITNQRGGLGALALDSQHGGRHGDCCVESNRGERCSV